MKFFGGILTLLYVCMGISCFHPYVFNMFFNFQALTFVPITIIGLIALIVIVESEDNDVVPVIPLIGMYLGLQHFYNTLNVLNFVLDNFSNIVIGIVFYVLLGFIWTIPKMKLYVRKNHTALMMATMANHTPEGVVDRFLATNKVRIYGWVIYWPFNIVHTLTSDVVGELFNYIYERLGKVYHRIIMDEVIKINHLEAVTVDGVVKYVNKEQKQQYQQQQQQVPLERRNSRLSTAK